MLANKSSKKLYINIKN